MNKEIKEYIDNADYNELMEIMEVTNDRILSKYIITDNFYGAVFSALSIAAEYDRRLHLTFSPPKTGTCNCANI